MNTVRITAPQTGTRNLPGSGVAVLTYTPPADQIGREVVVVLSCTSLASAASTLTATITQGGVRYGQQVAITKADTFTTRKAEVGPIVLDGGQVVVTLASSSGSDTAVSVTASVVAEPLLVGRTPTNPAQRLLDGQCCLGGIADSYGVTGTTIKTMIEALIDAGGRWTTRGSVALAGGHVHPISGFGSALQSPTVVASGATFPGSSGLVNNLPVSLNAWSFVSDLGAFTALQNLTPLDTNRIGSDPYGKIPQPWDLCAAGVEVEFAAGYHRTLNSVTGIHVSIFRAGGGSNGETFDASGSAALYQSLRRFRSTAISGSGSETIRYLLNGDETGKEFFPYSLGWRASRGTGIVFAGELAAGGESFAYFNAGGQYSDTQLDAWFAAHAGGLEAIDTLMVNLGINSGSLTKSQITTNCLAFLNRWIPLGQAHTRRPFHVLLLTPTPYLSANATDQTARTQEITEAIYEAARQYGRPDLVQVVDVHRSMRELYGNVANWGPTYLRPEPPPSGTGRLHFEDADGLTAFGTAIRHALERAADESRQDTLAAPFLAASAYTAPLDAAATRSALGLAAADLDTQLDGLATQASVDAIAALTPDNKPSVNADGEVATTTAATGSLAAATTITHEASGADLVVTITANGYLIDAWGHDAAAVVNGVDSEPGIALPIADVTDATSVQINITGRAAWATDDLAVNATIRSTDGREYYTQGRVSTPPQPTNAAILAAVQAGGGGGTVTAEDIADKRTWRFPRSGSEITASNYVKAAAGQAGPVTVCFDLDTVLEPNVVVSAITSATITGSAATVGTPVAHTSKRKVNVPLTSVTATANDYIVTLTIVATDSEQYVVRGTLQVE